MGKRRGIKNICKICGDEIIGDGTEQADFATAHEECAAEEDADREMGIESYV